MKHSNQDLWLVFKGRRGQGDEMCLEFVEAQMCLFVSAHPSMIVNPSVVLSFFFFFFFFFLS